MKWWHEDTNSGVRWNFLELVACNDQHAANEGPAEVPQGLRLTPSPFAVGPWSVYVTEIYIKKTQIYPSPTNHPLRIKLVSKSHSQLTNQDCISKWKIWVLLPPQLWLIIANVLNSQILLTVFRIKVKLLTILDIKDINITMNIYLSIALKNNFTIFMSVTLNTKCNSTINL